MIGYRKIAGFSLQTLSILCSLWASPSSTLRMYTVKKLSQDVTSNTDLNDKTQCHYRLAFQYLDSFFGKLSNILKLIVAAVNPGCSDF